MKRDQKRSKSVKHIHSYSPSNRQSKSHGASPAVTPPHYSKGILMPEEKIIIFT